MLLTRWSSPMNWYVVSVFGVLSAAPSGFVWWISRREKDILVEPVRPSAETSWERGRETDAPEIHLKGISSMIKKYKKY